MKSFFPNLFGAAFAALFLFSPILILVVPFGGLTWLIGVLVVTLLLSVSGRLGRRRATERSLDRAFDDLRRSRPTPDASLERASRVMSL